MRFVLPICQSSRAEEADPERQRGDGEQHLIIVAALAVCALAEDTTGPLKFTYAT